MNQRVKPVIVFRVLYVYGVFACVYSICTCACIQTYAHTHPDLSLFIILASVRVKMIAFIILNTSLFFKNLIYATNKIQRWTKIVSSSQPHQGSKEVIMIVAKARSINAYSLFCFISFLDFGLNFYLLKINTHFKHNYYTIFYHYSLNDF